MGQCNSTVTGSHLYSPVKGILVTTYARQDGRRAANIGVLLGCVVGFPCCCQQIGKRLARNKITSFEIRYISISHQISYLELLRTIMADEYPAHDLTGHGGFSPPET